ncbi:CUB domain [Popillia japonica]|uniref:CUB domain n=1 Tax=Popillia japonica TaxID=7064 RepID=A0AAW1MNM3_POPJA
MNKIVLFEVVLLYYLMVGTSFLYERQDRSNTSIIERRQPRFIGLFSWGWGIGVVRFQNSPCTGETGLVGTCYTRRQCSDIGGSASGSCASNIGVCCVLQLGCGNSSSYNNTYFVNTNYPTPVTGGSRCVYTIEKCNSDICQARIEFISVTLAQPDGDGNCVNDTLTIRGGGSVVPVICGENSGQHVYVQFYADQDIQIEIVTSTGTFSRIWNLRVMQIACNCPTIAPSGCLMYYTSASGIVNSFNYGSTESSTLNSIGATGTRQLVNQNYGVCVAMIPGYCSIVWSQTSYNSFTVSNDTEAYLFGSNAGTFGNECPYDFVIVPAPYLTNGSLFYTDRFCGNYFPTVESFSKPFVLTVVNNENDTADVANRGFSLSYSQQLCR